MIYVCSGSDATWRAKHPVPARDVARHLDVYRAQLEEASLMRPIKINSHTGNDYMTRSQMEKLFNGAMEIEKKSGITVPMMHETHRKRALHSPWATRDLLPSLPNLKVCQVT